MRSSYPHMDNLHGLGAVAALKLYTARLLDIQPGRSPRSWSRGRIEASPTAGDRVNVGNLHGLGAVAALKLATGATAPIVGINLHGLGAVAALKPISHSGRGDSARRISTVLEPWPH